MTERNYAAFAGVNTYDSLICERLAKGKAEGKAEGIVEGKAEERRSTLAKLLRLKFGELSDEALSRIETAEYAALDRCTERVLFAATLDEVFGA